MPVAVPVVVAVLAELLTFPIESVNWSFGPYRPCGRFFCRRIVFGYTQLAMSMCGICATTWEISAPVAGSTRSTYRTPPAGLLVPITSSPFGPNARELYWPAFAGRLLAIGVAVSPTLPRVVGSGPVTRESIPGADRLALDVM